MFETSKIKQIFLTNIFWKRVAMSKLKFYVNVIFFL